MRLQIAILSLLLVLVGGLVALVFAYNDRALLFFAGNDQPFPEFISHFQNGHSPLAQLNLAALYHRNGSLQVLHPLLDVQHVSLQQLAPACETNAIAARQRFADSSCSEALPTEIADASAEKDQVLTKILNDGSGFRESFLTAPPYITTSGSSYAYLLQKKGTSTFNNKGWVEEHLSFFRPAELKEVLAKFAIVSPSFEVISKLDADSIEHLVRGESPIISDLYFFVRQQADFGFSPLSYQVYSLTDLRASLAGGKFDVVPMASSQLCLESQGNVCWTYNAGHAVTFVHHYLLCILLLAALMAGAVFYLFVRQLLNGNLEQRKSRLALQVLSHEFRTPVSSMLLAIEQLGNSRLEPGEQDLISRLSSDVYRLQRVIETSKTYLQAEHHKILFKKILIPSINEWIADFVVDFGFRIDCIRLESDEPLVADPYWLRYMLSALLQNAVAHGQAPIVLRIEKVKSQLRLTVEDQGHCEFEELGEMTAAFTKSRKSGGMGLGLNIVKIISEETGGEFYHSSSPTSFTLALKTLETV